MQEQVTQLDQEDYWSRLAQRAIMVLSILFVVFHLYTEAFGRFTAMVQRPVHLSFAILLVFLLMPAKEGVRPTLRQRLFSMILGLAGVGTFVWIIYGYLTLALDLRITIPDPIDIVLGIIAFVVLIEATRRVVGLMLPIMMTVAFIYLFIGPWLPWPFGHGGFELSRVIGNFYVYTEGIWSSTLGVSAGEIMAFIIFAAILMETGAGEFYIKLANSLLGSRRGGPAKVAVLSSTFFGSISGSTAANVAATGMFTIPMMKRAGYKSEFAAAVEAVASSCGQITPPVLGATAFLIIELLGIPYVALMSATVIPAMLYLGSVFITVDFEAVRLRLRGIPKAEIPRFWIVLKEGWSAFLPLVVLILFILVLESSLLRAVFWSTVCVVLVTAFQDKTRLTLARAINACKAASRNILVVAMATACAGIVSGIISYTGLGLRISQILLDLSGGNLAVLLVLAAIASFILGLGLPTPAAYIMLAVTVAPAIVKMGVEPISAHLFVMFFGLFAPITPPDMTATFVAAAIAKADPVKAGWQATKLMLVPAYIPFLFVLRPGLMGFGIWADILVDMLFGIIAVAALAGGLHGFMFKRCPWVERAALFAVPVLVVMSSPVANVIGVALFAAIFARHLFPWGGDKQGELVLESGAGG